MMYDQQHTKAPLLSSNSTLLDDRLGARRVELFVGARAEAFHTCTELLVEAACAASNEVEVLLGGGASAHEKA